MGQDLFLAIDHRDLQGVQDLLKAGADPNSRNGLEFTPLYIAVASHQDEVMQALLDAGAKPDATSAYGTALTFACATANLNGAKTLLARGAKVNFLRNDGMTPLMQAANTGFPPMVAELLKNKADITVKDDGGCTALSLAARQGHTPILNMLLGAGAKANDADVDGVTPLMEAAMNGHADCVGILLKHGAKVDAKDSKGRTALAYAAAYGDYPEVINVLRKNGAAPSKSAALMAAARGYKHTALALGARSVSMVTKRTPRQALNLSLKIIQSSMLSFTESATCVSCHQEGLGRITTGEAKDRGFQVDKKVQTIQSQRINGMVNGMKPLHQGALHNPEVMKQLPLIEINEVNTMYAWVMAGMAAQGQPANDATGAMALVLAKQQSKDGCWTFSLPRVPMQSSPVTFTALSVRSLNAYGPKSDSAEIHERIGRAKDWLMHVPVQNSEDRASRLLGLKWAGAGAADRKASVDAIRADQRADGGWAQLPNLQSDAYATGQALYAMHVGGGVSVNDPAYKRGVQFLLRTQDPDGTWFVNKRAMPANNYFDAGFPHGESQYASFNGTNWAALALLQTIEAKPHVLRAH